MKKKTRETKMKPVKAWAIISSDSKFIFWDEDEGHALAFETRDDAKRELSAFYEKRNWRIARVEIRELAPKSRKR